MRASPGSVSQASSWQAESERLQLVLEPSGFEPMVAEAAAWAERITLCLTAPHSQRGSLPWWRELLSRSSKCDRIYLRRAEHAESWLLHRLHETGALRVIEGGGKQVAQNLLLFVRGAELRVLLSHISLERAVAGASFGALLSYQGSSSTDLARSCRAQADSWARLACLPSGSEVDWLALDPKGARPTPVPSDLPMPLRVVSDAKELEAHIERFSAQGLDGAVLQGGWTLSVRAFDSGFRLQFQHWERSRAPVLLTLHAGAAWAAGNGLMLETPSGEGVLAWRGGLLGTSRSKCDLLWTETRLATLQLNEAGLSPAQRAALGPAQRVALVARNQAEIAPQLSAFVRETCRLGDVFGVEPPPTLGHAVADFASLSARQQTLLLWRALIGLGSLDSGVATLLAVQALRDQGYLRGQDTEPGSSLHDTVAELLARAAEQGPGFDRPAEGQLRAIQPDVSAYVLDDWQECLLLGMPLDAAVGRRQALRLGFERARSHFGLSEPTLLAGGRVERLLESTLQSGLRRGLFVRVGAAGVRRATALDAAAAPPRRLTPSRSEDGLLSSWWRGLTLLSPTQRFLLTRRSGWYCRRETLESAAQRLGMPLERAQKLEQEAWQQLESSSDWGATLRERLTRAFAGSRALPVRLLATEDPWWQGIEQHTGLAEALFESLNRGASDGDRWHVVELGPPGQRETLFAAFPQAELDQALESLLARAAQRTTPAPLAEFEALPAELAAPLEPGLSEWFRDALQARLTLDPEDPGRVLAFSAGADTTLTQLPEPLGVDSEARLRLEDAVRSAFRSARTPLSLAAIAERIQQRVEVDTEALGVLLAHAPFVQRNADQYGLLARDVPGGPEAIATALDAVVEALEQSLRVLSLKDAVALVTAKVKQPWSLELVRSLLGSDPALCLSSTHDVRLRRWEHARLVAASELLCPGIPAPVRPRFEKLAQAPLLRPEEFGQKLELSLSRLERSAEADDLHALALARQLYDVCERLLQHTPQLSARGQQLAQAAFSCFIDALEQNEEDAEAPPIDRARLLEARAVLVAVLAELELPWL